MADGSDTITLNARCHCKSNNFDIVVPKSALPLRSAICQCNSCRHSTGISAPNSVSFPYNLGIKKPDLSNLTEYKTSAGLPRYFCGTCGAHVCTIELDCWDVTTGIIDQAGDLLSRLNVWTDDTGDGGFSVYLTENNGKEVQSYRTSSLESSASKGPVTAETIAEYKAKSKNIFAAESDELTESDEKMWCKCHCGGVDFYITRPNAKFPGPDPKHMDKNSGLWWLAKGKYRCNPCPCESCRRCSGYEINPWCYVPKSNVFWKDGTPMQFNEGTLKSYESTPGKVVREFCRVCGAKVFYRAPERREPSGVIDVSVGLFEGNSRAEDWLKWEPDVGFEDDALDIELFRSINNGIVKWNKEAEGAE
ncbi:hypothetical protein H072_6151 [Dactylellina haptotyla CBS 200.50]|uniref:CENP-V/GFA domain-containing protein n=1 Tax=Dactylellina haptotyla (strain CBS 200.50) TaxID=1284197 RepID=S8AAV8_DACHA|nr:hypothetical protein H072_6151 [Dactylellina haptotyla CBS 200.50]